MNTAIIAIYNQDPNKYGRLRVYSIDFRKIILDKTTDDLLDVILDSQTNYITLVVLFKEKISVYNSANDATMIETFSRKTEITSYKNYAYLFGNYLSYGFKKQNTKETTFNVWTLNYQNSHLVHYKKISNLEAYLCPNNPTTYHIQKVLFVSLYIITQECNYSESKDMCCIGIATENGVRLKQLLFENAIGECLGCLDFYHEKNKTIYIQRKDKEDALYLIDMKQYFKFGPPQNIMSNKVSHIEQYEENSFFIQKLFCKYIINSTFIASVSIRESLIENEAQNTVINIKKLNYFSHVV